MEKRGTNPKIAGGCSAGTDINVSAGKFWMDAIDFYEVISPSGV